MSASSFPASAREWFIATRPWSFTASAIPVFFGAALAAAQGSWNTGLFLLTIFGGTALHIGTNLHNTYGDFVSGVDSKESAVTCPELVYERLTPGAMYAAGWLAFAFALLAGIAVFWVRGWPILAFGLLGVAGGYYYTNGSHPYKYYGLGPYFVAFLMGPLMALPAWYIQTGSMGAGPILGSLSISCLVSAIMHGNDIRDIEYDRAAGIRTLAMGLGRARALKLFTAMNVGAFVILLLNVLTGILPPICLLPFALLPMLLAELARMRAPDYDCGRLEGWAAKFHFLFGLLMSAGLAALAVFRAP